MPIAARRMAVIDPTVLLEPLVPGVEFANRSSISISCRFRHYGVSLGTRSMRRSHVGDRIAAMRLTVSHHVASC